MKPLHVLLISLLTATPLTAILDSNQNTLSDLWEAAHNNQQLLDPQDPDHQPTADPDGDGWTNLEESVAGTDPFSSLSPGGMLRPDLANHPAIYGDPINGIPQLITPEAISLTWPTVPGKAYQIQYSADLTPNSWSFLPETLVGSGQNFTITIPLTQNDGSPPPSLFWRISVSDLDSDGDTLTNAEEIALNTDPYHQDTDLDGIPDNLDSEPLTNANLSDPDGHQMPPTIANDLVAWWDFQTQPSGTTNITYANRANLPAHPLTAFNATPALHCFADTGVTNLGTNPTRHHLGVLNQGSSLLGATQLSLNYWIQIPSNHLAIPSGQSNGPVITLLSYANTDAANPTLEWRARRSPGSGTRFTLNHFVNGIEQPIVTLGNWDVTEKIDDGAWHHLAITTGSSGNTIRMYLNGEQVGPSTTHAFSIPSNAWQYQGWMIAGGYKRVPPGYNNGIATSDLKGRIDSLMVHRRNLSSTEIESIYKRDRDSDGLWDITEVRSSLWRDHNSNTVAEESEFHHITSPAHWQPANTDTDGDGLTDLAEQNIHGTRIDRGDTDGDLIPDGWEIANQLDPLDSTDASEDDDQDGVTNLNEFRNKANPQSNDSDGDGTPDQQEINQGSHPGDSRDDGAPIPSEERHSILIAIGDQSSSHSEDYILNCYRIDPETQQEIPYYTLRSGGFGQYAEETKTHFRKGDIYTFQIQWMGTSNQTHSGTLQSPGPEGPDFDYTFRVEPQGEHNWLEIDSWHPGQANVDPQKNLLRIDTQDVADTHLEFQQNFQSRRFLLLPIHTHSTDRMFGGKFTLLPGFEALELSISNPDAQRDHGTHGYFGGGGNTTVHTNIRDLIGSGTTTVQTIEPPDQGGAWFLRDDPQAIDDIELYLISGKDGEIYGEIEIEFRIQGHDLGTIRQPLTPHEDFGELIKRATLLAAGTGLGFPDLQNGPPSENAVGLPNPEHWATPVLIPVFAVGQHVQNQAAGFIGLYDGIVTGLKDDWEFLKLIGYGIAYSADWTGTQLISELQKWRADPRARLTEIRDIFLLHCEQFICDALASEALAKGVQIANELTTIEGCKRHIWKIIYHSNPLTWSHSAALHFSKELQQAGINPLEIFVDSLAAWYEDFGNRMLQGAEKAAWIDDPLVTEGLVGGVNQTVRELSYTIAYEAGYISEQVAIGIITGGSTVIGAVLVKGGISLATKTIAKRTTAIIAGTGTLVKKAAAVTISVELRIAAERTLISAARQPIPLANKRPLLELLEERFQSQAFDRANFNWKIFAEEITAHPRLANLLENPVARDQFLLATGNLAHHLGDNATALALKNWPKLANAIAPLNQSGLTDDLFRSSDLFTALKIDTPQGQIVARQFLESIDAKTAQQIIEGGLPIPGSIKSLYPQMYHYADFSTLDGFADDLVNDVVGRWRLHENTLGRYVTPELIDTQALAKSKLQSPLNSALEEIPTKCRFRFEYSTSDLVGDYQIPRARVHSEASNAGEKLWREPIVKDNPARGSGGVPQFVEEAAREGTVFDAVTQQYVRDKDHLQEILNTNP